VDKDYSRRPAGLGDDHLGAELVELVPEVLGFEAALDAGQQEAVFGRRDGASEARRGREMGAGDAGRRTVDRGDGAARRRPVWRPLPGLQAATAAVD